MSENNSNIPATNQQASDFIPFYRNPQRFNNQQNNKYRPYNNNSWKNKNQYNNYQSPGAGSYKPRGAFNPQDFSSPIHNNKFNNNFNRRGGGGAQFFEDTIGSQNQGNAFQRNHQQKVQFYNYTNIFYY